MDTYEYIKWIHMGAQEPGPGPKLVAGPMGQGPGTLAHGPGTRAPPPVLGQGLAPGPPYVSILCIHMCPCVSICIHIYIYIYIYIS